jgi:hypothetical protein
MSTFFLNLHTVNDLEHELISSVPCVSTAQIGNLFDRHVIKVYPFLTSSYLWSNITVSLISRLDIIWRTARTYSVSMHGVPCNIMAVRQQFYFYTSAYSRFW